MDNWQKSVRSRALPEEAMTGWNEGMIRLQQLAERLNRQDEQRGKYMTVSELKTEVFGIMQAFNRHIPAEEQLRRYGEVRNQNGSEQQQKQAEEAVLRSRVSERNMQVSQNGRVYPSYGGNVDGTVANAATRLASGARNILGSIAACTAFDSVR